MKIFLIIFLLVVIIPFLIYVYSKVQMYGWIKGIEKYINKFNEQEEQLWLEKEEKKENLQEK